MTTDTSLTLTLDDRDEALLLFGSRDQHLRLIRETLGVRLVARGDFVHVEGTPVQVDQAQRIFQQLRLLLKKQGKLTQETCAASWPSSAAVERRRSAEPARHRRQPPGPATHRWPGPLRSRPARQRPDLLHRPGRHRQDLPRRRHGRQPAAAEAVSARSSWSALRSRPARNSASCPATSWPRSTRICGRCSTPWAK